MSHELPLYSTDLRTYVEKGVQHVRSDEFSTQFHLENWMRETGTAQKKASGLAQQIIGRHWSCAAPYKPHT